MKTEMTKEQLEEIKKAIAITEKQRDVIIALTKSLTGAAINAICGGKIQKYFLATTHLFRVERILQKGFDDNNPEVKNDNSDT